VNATRRSCIGPVLVVEPKDHELKLYRCPGRMMQVFSANREEAATWLGCHQCPRRPGQTTLAEGRVDLGVPAPVLHAEKATLDTRKGRGLELRRYLLSTGGSGRPPRTASELNGLQRTMGMPIVDRQAPWRRFRPLGGD
jgi:hypothetical protein